MLPEVAILDPVPASRPSPMDPEPVATVAWHQTWSAATTLEVLRLGSDCSRWGLAMVRPDDADPFSPADGVAATVCALTQYHWATVEGGDPEATPPPGQPDPRRAALRLEPVGDLEAVAMGWAPNFAWWAAQERLIAERGQGGR